MYGIVRPSSLRMTLFFQGYIGHVTQHTGQYLLSHMTPPPFFLFEKKIKACESVIFINIPPTAQSDPQEQDDIVPSRLHCCPAYRAVGMRIDQIFNIDYRFILSINYR